jgi:mannobiose 2-epimerase
MQRNITVLRLAATGLFILMMGLASCKTDTYTPTATDRLYEREIRLSLDTLAHVWYPRVLDTMHGGYWSDYNFSWDADGIQNKMIVSQARHVWATAVLGMFYDEDEYMEMSRHGFHFLRDHLWDEKNGGFYTLKGMYGDSLPLLSNTKSSYGNAFAIYGLATYYKASGETGALELAKKTFYWLEEHAHDPKYKGYFDVLKQDGSWMLDVKTNDGNYENFNRKDWKDQNSSIHLMEAFTALYDVWPDELLRERLQELLVLIRDTITTPKGYLSLHLQRDWTPVSYRDSSETARQNNFYLDHVSFGHDVETAYLMLETSHMLGLENDTLTLGRAKKMVDHAIDKGWDNRLGGFYDGGYYYDDSDNCTIVSNNKVWWTEAEGLNALLLMARLFPEEPRYQELFEEQWIYLQRFVIDHEYGGWYHEGLDTNPHAIRDAKANIWKTSYHNVRALMNVIGMLNGTDPLTNALTIENK